MPELPYTIDDMRAAVQNRRVLWRDHAVEKMLQREIRKQEVKECIFNGEIVEEYHTDRPFPSCLIFSYTEANRPIHVVCSMNEGVLYIITAYEPNLFKWQEDYKTRRIKE